MSERVSLGITRVADLEMLELRNKDLIVAMETADEANRAKSDFLANITRFARP